MFRCERLLSGLFAPALKLPQLLTIFSSFSSSVSCARELGPQGQAKHDPLKVQVRKQAAAVFLAVGEGWSRRPSGVPASHQSGPCSQQAPSGHACPAGSVGGW